MRLMRPDPATALLGLRAMKTIATASGEIGPAQGNPHVRCVRVSNA